MSLGPMSQAPSTLKAPEFPAVTLWQNPDCSKSRRALQLLEMTPAEVTLRDYRAEPPTLDELREVLGMLNMGPRAIVRTSEAIYGELALAEASDDQLVEAMSKHPALIQRPIAIARGRAVLGRPPELVLGLLAPEMPDGLDQGELLRRIAQGKLG